MKQTLNLRLLVYLVGAIIVLVPGVHFLHGYQVKRNAAFFVEQADKAQKDGDLQKAAGYYRRYLDLDPHDRHKALAKYGELLADARLAKSVRAKEQAYYRLEQALRRDPENHDVRRIVIRLAMDPLLQRYGEALDELNALNAALGEDAEQLKLVGQCQIGLRKFKEARTTFEKSIALAAKDSNDFEPYLGLAFLLRDKGAEVIAGEKNLKEVHNNADAAIASMLSRFAGSHRACLGAAHYYRRFAASIGTEIGADAAKALADKQILNAHQLAPDELEAILAFAALKREDGKNDAAATAAAREELQRGLKLHGKERALYQALANLEMQDQKPEEALAILRLGLKELPNDLELNWNLALLFTHQDLEKEARQQIADLEKVGFPRTELDYLEARLKFKKERWQEAARILKKIYPLLAGRADQKRDWLAIDLVFQNDLLLALCYEQMGDPYAASAVYARALTRFPNDKPFRFGLARTEWALGRLDNAQREYDVLLSSPRPPVQAWIESLQLQIERTLKDPARGWSAVELKLNQADSLKITAVEVKLMRAEVLAARKDYDEARKVLESAHADKAQRPTEVWIGLASLEQQRGRFDDALALLHEAERLHGDRLLELWQARCRYWARRGGAEAPRALDQIQLGLGKLKPEQQTRLLSTLAHSYLQISETARAKEMWRQVAERVPTNLRCRMALFELAQQENDQAAMSEQVAVIRDEIEGTTGVVWRYCQASQLVAAAQKNGDKKSLAKAGELLALVADRRPTWGRVLVMQGLMHDLLSNYDVAIERYQRAMALGEESIGLLERTVRLLRGQGRLAEVDVLIQQLPALAKGTYGELDRIGAESALRLQDLPKALSLARRAIPADSKDYRDHLWLGDFHWAAGKAAEADLEFRLALKLAPDVPATWVALVAHLSRSGAKSKAEETLAEMAKALPKERSHLALAYELVGQSKQAKGLLDAALAANPSDREVLRGLAFAALRQGDSDEARKHLEKLITLADSSPAKLAEDKRLLAVVLSSKRDYGDTVQALRLLGVLDTDAPQLASAPGENVADQRAKIIVLARAQNPRQRRQAIGLLESLIRRQQITSDERFLLAQLYESVGEWPKARQQYHLLLTMTPSSLDMNERAKAAWQKMQADLLSAYCLGLLRNDALGDIEPWLVKLEALEPKTLRSVGLRTQLLHKLGHGEKAVPELLALEKNQERTTAPVASLLELIGENKLAEDLYKKLAQQPMKADAGLALAQFYGRRQRTDEALALCQASFKAGSIEPAAAVAVLVLYTGKASDEQSRRVADWITAALKQNEKSTALMNHLAAARRLQKDYSGVTALFRRVVEQDAKDTLALNNLAWVLAVSGSDAAEALATVERAIALDGPLAELLDTRGMCHLKCGKADAAVKDFQEAIAETATATRYFHLAHAHYLAKNRSAALDAFRNAERLKLTEEVLDPLEAPAYHQLRAELGTKSAAAR